MSGELPLSRNYAAVGRPLAATVRRPAAPTLARKSTLGLSLFGLLVFLCLLDMNTVAYNLWGVLQVFSVVILVVCLLLLLVYRITVYRDLGPSGRLYVLFIAAFFAIGTPIGLNADPEGILGRWFLIRLILASVLIVLAAAVAARHVLLAYGLRFTLRGLFAISLLVPLAVWVFSYYPSFYRVQVGQARDFARATGTFNNPNEAAVAVCMTTAVILSFMMIEKSKILSIAALALSAFAIMLTISRGGYVIFTVIVLAQVVISPGFKKIVLSLVGGAIVAAMVYAVYNFATIDDSSRPGEVSRIEQLGRVLKGDISDETTGGRFELAMNGIREWQKSPLLGNGIGTQRRVGAANIGPHNTYILIMGEAGLVPLALFLAMIASMLWYGWKCHVPAIRTFAMTYALVLGIACLTGHGAIMSREHAVMMGICFGFLAACVELKNAARRNPMSNRAVAPGQPRPAQVGA